jgi:hypothetical protein
VLPFVLAEMVSLAADDIADCLKNYTSHEAQMRFWVQYGVCEYFGVEVGEGMTVFNLNNV